MQRMLAHWPLKALVTSAVVIAGFVFCLAWDLPGHLSYDSVIQLLEGRTGAYSGWHPPVMSWLLGVFDWLHTGTALFVVFDALLFFGSLLALVWLRPQRSWAAAIVAALICASPIALLYQGIVWKDVLFADASVGGFAAIAWAAAYWPHKRIRFLALAKGLVLLGLAGMARQNGMLAVAIAVVAIAWIASRHVPLRQAFIYGAGALAFAVVFITSANVALGLRIDQPSAAAKQLRLLQFYDTIGFVALDKTLPLNELHAYAPDLEREMRSDGVRLYNPERNDPLGDSQKLQAALDAAPWNAVRGQWLDLIIHHPWDYIKIRAEVFRWIFATPDIEVCLPYLTGISGPDGEMGDLGIKPRDDARDETLSAYASHFIKTPILSHVFYALLSIGCLILLLLRRRPEDIAIAGLQAAALTFTASFFIIGIACDYRYCYALDIAALVGVFYLALDPPLHEAQRSWRGRQSR